MKTDIIISHCPPLNHCDFSWRKINGGCKYLAERVIEVKPLLHCFGHIHEAYSKEKGEYTHYCNCSVIDNDAKVNCDD